MAAFFLTFSLLFLCPSPGFGTTAAHAPTCCPAQSPINKLIHKAAIVPAFGQGLIKFLFAITFLGFVFVLALFYGAMKIGVGGAPQGKGG